MKTISATSAQSTLPILLEETASTHEPIQITSDRATAMLIAEDDWRLNEETLYLLSRKGMRESIIKGLNTPIAECSSSLMAGVNNV
jgi:PHD/YefM family antitoxin component YafN of YafNO toxin-antitoxin module